MRSRYNAKVNLQRRHFELIARTIASFTAGPGELRDSLARHFANNLRWTNSHFDADKFIQWANGDERSQSEILAKERLNAKIERQLKKENKALFDSLAKPLAEIEKSKALVEKLANLAGRGKVEKLGGRHD